MKKFRFLWSLMALPLLAACSQNDLRPDQHHPNFGPNSDDGVFFAVNIDLPSAGGTRSETDAPIDGTSASDAGFEIGKDYENYVGDVIIVLARKTNNSFIAASRVPTNSVKPVNHDKASYQLTSSISLTDMAAFYDSLGANEEDFDCNIYVFANPGETISNMIFGKEASADGSTAAVAPVALGNTTWINSVLNLTDVPTKNIANKAGNSDKGSFLMSNAEIAVRTIPSTINDWRHYTSDANPFDLSGDNAEVSIDNGAVGRGAVKLERAAARFDFRDGSPLREADGTNAFTYHVVKGDAGVEGVNESNLIDVVLSNMSLVNVNKQFYALKRVSADGFNTGVSICGPERPWTKNLATGVYSGGNYVVDADQVWKTATAQSFDGNNAPANVQYATHFFYPLFTDAGIVNNQGSTGADKWKTDNCAAVVNGELDNKETWNSDGTYKDYHIWTYATENTIAGMDNQKNGVSTGVVFKGKMVATDDAKDSKYPDVKELAQTITNASANSPYLFSFGGNIYVGWENIRNAAISSAVSGIKWVPESEEDPTKGSFEFTSVDRSNSLYVAVFGNGGFGEVQFTYTEYDVDTKKPVTDADGKVIQHKGIIKDDLQEDSNCTDAKWKAYEAAANGQPKALALAAFKEKATTGEKITIYEASNDPVDGWGFYCYYYYWNRHNNNGEPGIMGPMEFAVVRNNVYKLAVTNIKQLGHPRFSENDPNRPTGGTDDEVSDVYLTVTAEILPWVVRINDIEF